MKNYFGAAAVGAAIAILGTPAAAQVENGLSHDMQCFIGASMLVESTDDAQAEQVGMWAAMYFVGKIYGARPGIDFQAAMEAEAPKMESVDMQALMLSCFSELEAKGNEIERAGKALEAKGL